jgi:hypothetical protein
MTFLFGVPTADQMLLKDDAGNGVVPSGADSFDTPEAIHRLPRR